jgi:hypothetical protein
MAIDNQGFPVPEKEAPLKFCLECGEEISNKENIEHPRMCEDCYNRFLLYSNYEAEQELKSKTYYCCICHINIVDAMNGFDTCADCLKKI